MIRIYINSEKLIIDTDHMTTEEILQCAGFPVSPKYSVINEITRRKYVIGDTVELQSNTNLFINVENDRKK